MVDLFVRLYALILDSFLEVLLFKRSLQYKLVTWTSLISVSNNCLILDVYNYISNVNNAVLRNSSKLRNQLKRKLFEWTLFLFGISRELSIYGTGVQEISINCSNLNPTHPVLCSLLVFKPNRPQVFLYMTRLNVIYCNLRMAKSEPVETQHRTAEEGTKEENGSQRLSLSIETIKTHFCQTWDWFGKRI